MSGKVPSRVRITKTQSNTPKFAGNAVPKFSINNCGFGRNRVLCQDIKRRSEPAVPPEPPAIMGFLSSEVAGYIVTLSFNYAITSPTQAVFDAGNYKDDFTISSSNAGWDTAGNPAYTVTIVDGKIEFELDVGAIGGSAYTISYTRSGANFIGSENAPSPGTVPNFVSKPITNNNTVFTTVISSAYFQGQNTNTRWYPGFMFGWYLSGSPSEADWLEAIKNAMDAAGITTPAYPVTNINAWKTEIQNNWQATFGNANNQGEPARTYRFRTGDGGGGGNWACGSTGDTSSINYMLVESVEKDKVTRKWVVGAGNTPCGHTSTQTWNSCANGNCNINISNVTWTRVSNL